MRSAKALAGNVAPMVRGSSGVQLEEDEYMGGIWWLASYPKSGNTWVRVFLANLLFNPDQPFDINQMPRAFFSDAMGRPYAQLANKPISALSRTEVLRLRLPIQHMLANQDVDLIFVKTHSAIATIYGMPTFDLSLARGVVYILRNPLDVVVSFAHHMGRSPAEAVTTLCSKKGALRGGKASVWQFTGSWSDHVKSWTTAPGLRCHVVRYEDMSRRPVKAFGAIADHIGLPYDRAGLRRAIRFSAFETLAGQEKEHGFIEQSSKSAQFFRKGQIGDWRSVLTQDQVAQMIEANREVMIEHGYLTENGKPRT